MTTVFAIAMVRDEADIIEQTVRNMLTQVHEVIVADNGSTDGTREILEQLPVQVIDDPEVGYYQSRKMTALAARAAQQGANWVIPFDADEWWMSPFGRIADILKEHPQAATAPALVYDHVATGQDANIADPVQRIEWRRTEPLELPKVAARAALPVTIEQGNHGAAYPTVNLDGQLIVRHFPYRSVEQFVRKTRNGAAAYAASDLPDHYGAHWRQWGDILNTQGEDAVAAIFREWYWTADPAGDPALIRDPCPA